MVLLWEGSPAAIVTNLLLWVVVAYLQSRSSRQQNTATAAARAAPATVLVRSVPVTTMTASSARKITLTPATH
jgi:hypothetical protein